MSQILIKNNPLEKRTVSEEPFLKVSEFFTDTIQGEGIYTGSPAAFLRLQGCTLNCTWCDTKSVWNAGNPYSFKELFALMESVDLITKMANGQHLVLTGGSPLLQQSTFITFINAFIHKYEFKPFIEIENEAIITPLPRMIDIVDCWNNSPKLTSSGNNNAFRERVLFGLSRLRNSWFKFVISNEKDWEEVKRLYISTDLIRKDQVILMPEGQTRQEVLEHQHYVAKIAVKNNVKFSTRMHLILWDLKTGV